MRILIAGDFCPRDRVAALFEKEDYASVLGSVKELFTEADYSIVNFECPVTRGDEKPIQKLGPNHHCTEKGMAAIKWLGVDCVTLANNHFYDFGDAGVANTMDVCRKHEIDTVGGGNNLAEASRVLYKKINGQTLAIINCCEHEFSIASDHSAGSNPLNPIKQYYSIKEARKNADYVIVIIHGGHELFQLPSPRMVDTYRFFVDSGADAVVNHHQHCYSGYEVYKGKPIFYGLGNFCFDNPKRHDGIWTEGYAISIKFSSDHPVFDLYPYHQCDAEPRVELLSHNAFDAKLAELNAIINNPTWLMATVEAYYATCTKTISNIFEPLYNRYYLAAKIRGWLPSLVSKKRKTAAKDLVICEAHRDKLTYWLNK